MSERAPWAIKKAGRCWNMRSRVGEDLPEAHAGTVREVEAPMKHPARLPHGSLSTDAHEETGSYATCAW
jgi:hypothetical protein